MPVAMTEDNKKKLGLSGATNLSAPNPQSSRSRNRLPSYVDQSSRSRNRLPSYVDQSSRSRKPNIIDQSSRSNQGPGGIPLPGGEGFKAGGLPSISTFGDGANAQNDQRSRFDQVVGRKGDQDQNAQRAAMIAKMEGGFTRNGGGRRNARPENPQLNRGTEARTQPENYVDPQGSDTAPPPYVNPNEGREVPPPAPYVNPNEGREVPPPAPANAESFNPTPQRNRTRYTGRDREPADPFEFIAQEERTAYAPTARGDVDSFQPAPRTAIDKFIGEGATPQATTFDQSGRPDQGLRPDQTTFDQSNRPDQVTTFDQSLRPDQAGQTPPPANLQGLLTESENLGMETAAGVSPPGARRSATTDALESKFLGQIADPSGRDVSMGNVGQQLDSRLTERLGTSGGAEDAIAARQRADFEEQSADRRRQLESDLNRYGIIGGGSSGGAAADVLGKFEAGVGRGLLDIGANQQLRRDADLDRAQSFSDAENRLGTENRSASQFDTSQAADFSRNLDDLEQRKSRDMFDAGTQRINTSQDVADRAFSRRMALTGPSGAEEFAESRRRADRDAALASRRLDIGEGQFGEGLTEEARQFDVSSGQQESQFGRNLSQRGSEFTRGLGEEGRQFDNRLLSDQESQDRSLAQQESQFSRADDEQSRRFDNELGLRSSQFGQTLDEASRRFDNTEGRNAAQFMENLAEQSRQFDNRTGQTESQFGQSLDEESRRFDNTLGSQNQQFLDDLGIRKESLGVERDRLSEQERQFDRGLGSSENESRLNRIQQNRQFQDNLFEQRQGRVQQGSQFEAELGQQDRQFAGDLDFRGEQLAQQGDLSRAELFGGEINPQTGMERRTLGSRQLQQQEDQFEAELGQQDRQFGAQNELSRAELFGGEVNPQTGMRRRTLASRQLGQQGDQFDESLQEQRLGRISRDKLAEEQLFGGRFNTQGRLERETLGGRQLSSSEAESRKDRNMQESQFGRSLTEQKLGRKQQGAQFGKNLGLDRERMTQQDRQFVDSLGEQTSDRNQRARLAEEELFGGRFNTQGQLERETLGGRRLGQQDTQFDDSLEEQRTARRQQGTQFDDSLGEQTAGRISRDKLAEQELFGGKFNTQGQLERETVGGRQSRNQTSQFDRSLALDQERLDNQGTQFERAQDFEEDQAGRGELLDLLGIDQAALNSENLDIRTKISPRIDELLLSGDRSRRRTQTPITPEDENFGPPSAMQNAEIQDLIRDGVTPEAAYSKVMGG